MKEDWKERMITGRKIAHIGIAVNDVKADAEWYIKMLGCETMGIFLRPMERKCIS